MIREDTPVDDMSLSQSIPRSVDDPQVVEAVEQYLASLDTGQAPDRQQLLDRFPQLASELSACLDGLEFIHQVAPQYYVDSPEGPDELSTAWQASARTLGDFRILRKIGQGGMGVVYEAEQYSLQRRVALKVLPFAAMLDPRQLKRFHTEAAAAAGLHHTNIVPVFSVGCERSVHFYAMQYIEGATLAEVIRQLRQQEGLEQETRDNSHQTIGRMADTLTTATDRFSALRSTRDDRTPAHPSVAGSAEVQRSEPDGEGSAAISTARSTSSRVYFRRVAELCVQVAEALDYAHQEGVVHRDVKPSNLILDERGNVWVTDFGLAHVGKDPGLTRSGDIVGTLRYMSPEQALAKRVMIDHRSDIYSLGVTLYEMLTLRPAFAADDCQELLRQVAFEEPRPPRYWNKRAPAELETIVLKATVKDPAGRYATAQELADDLRRFLDDKPIHAKRPTLMDRAAKWSRRHVAFVWSAVIILALATLGSAFAAIRISRSTTFALKAEQQAEQAKRDAQEKLAHSYLDQARANRLSRRIGQRHQSLRLLRDAVRLAGELRLGGDFYDEMRNEAIAAMGLTDLRQVQQSEWQYESGGAYPNSRFTRFLDFDVAGRVVLRQFADGGEICQLPGEGYDYALAISPDGKFVAAVDQQRQFRIWDVQGSVPSALLKADVKNSAFGFSADSQKIAVGRPDGSFAIYDLNSALEVQRIQSDGCAGQISFHPSLPRIAVHQENKVRVFDIETGDKIDEITQPGTVFSLAWDRFGTHMAVVTDEDQRVHIWNLAKRQIVQVLPGLPLGTYAAFDPSNTFLATSGWDHVTRLWHWPTGELILKTENPVGAVNFSRDGRFLGPSIQNRKMGYWEVQAAPEHRMLVFEMALGKGYYIEPAISPDGRLLFVSMNRGVAVWDLIYGRELGLLAAHQGDKEKGVGVGVAVDSTGAVLTGGQKTFRWPIRQDIASPNVVHLGPPELITSASGEHIACSRDGKTLVISQGDGALIIHRDGLQDEVSLQPHADCRYVAISPDGQWAATGSHFYGGLKVWDAAHGTLVKELLAEHGWIRSVFSPDGRWLLSNQSNEQSSRLWRVGTWEEGPALGAGGFGAVFSPDSKFLAVGTTQGIRLVEAETGRDLARLEDQFEDRPEYCQFSPDGTRLVVVSRVGRRVHVWDLQLIGKQLHDMGLDWDLPPIPDSPTEPPPPVRLQLHLGVLTGKDSAGKTEADLGLASPATSAF